MPLPFNLAYLTNIADLVYDSESITADSEDSDYPFSNVRIDTISEPGQTDGETTLDLLIDLGALGSPQNRWDLAAIINHNFTEAAVVTLKAGTTNGTSDFSQVMTWAEFNIWYRAAAYMTYRYVRITVSDPGNPAGYLSIGGIRIGLSTQLETGVAWGRSHTPRSINRVTVSQFGAKGVDHLYQQESITVEFDALTDDAPDVVAWLKSLKREGVPLVVIPNPEEASAFYVRLVSDFNHLEFPAVQIPEVTFEEESRGLRMGA